MERDKSFDILKGIGIIAVVLGHFIEPYRANHFIFKGILVLIYSFHMPLFSFVSGYFGRFSSKSIINTVKVYFGFQFVYVVYRLIMGIIPLQPIEIIKALLVPYWHLWYLFALFFWRLSLFVFRKVEKIYFRIVILLVLFAVALVAGYQQLPLDFQRTLVFFPYFVLGYFFKDYYGKVKEFIDNKIYIKFLNAAFLVGAVSVIFALSDKINVQIVSPYQTYEEGGYTMSDRMIFLSVAIVLVYLLLVNARYIKCSFLEYIGRYTMPIYGLHALPFKYLYKTNIIFKVSGTNQPILIAIFVFANVALWIFVFSRSFFTKKRSFNIEMFKKKNNHV